MPVRHLRCLLKPMDLWSNGTTSPMAVGTLTARWRTARPKQGCPPQPIPARAAFWQPHREPGRRLRGALPPLQAARGRVMPRCRPAPVRRADMPIILQDPIAALDPTMTIARIQSCALPSFEPDLSRLQAGMVKGYHRVGQSPDFLDRYSHRPTRQSDDWVSVGITHWVPSSLDRGGPESSRLLRVRP